MAKQIFEKTQPGNPHQLPVRQHVFPKRSISRFADNRGLVWVQHITPYRVHPALPGNDIFCAMRAWDARAERGYMLQIEDEFQELASRIISGTTLSIGSGDKQKADAFFALWKMRAIFASADRTEVQFNSVTGENFTQDQEEIGEKAGVYFFREGGTMPAHRVHGLQIQRRIDDEVSSLSSVKWGVIRSIDGQFVVPDFPAIAMIPIGPTVCLSSGGTNGIASRLVVADINCHTRARSKAYFFAQELGMCP